MRLPFPERIPLPPVFFGAIILAGLQQLQGTSITFTIFSFLFIVIATITFNLAGGFTRTSGSYVFFYATLGVIIGLVYKAYLGEPADSNLESPVLTMEVFTGGITAMLLAVSISRKISRKKPLLFAVLKVKDMRNAAIGCFAFGFFLVVLGVIVPHENGSILSAFLQLNRFLQMSVIIGTLAAIQSSGGKRSINLVVILAIGFSCLIGLLVFSKEGMFSPLLCWLVAAASKRMNFRLYQFGIGLFIVFLLGRYLVPYAQYGRSQVPLEYGLSERTAAAISMLADLGTVRVEYQNTVNATYEMDQKGYYNSPQGFFDRLTMIGPDDALIHYTSLGNYSGLDVIPAYFANWIPHVFWPNKPPLPSGNILAHKIGGIVGDDDDTTGISFTPTGEAYQLAGWTGIFVIAPLIWIPLFTIFDSLCGDVRQSPWGLLVIALFAHVAPEAMIGGAVYIMWYGAIGVIFVAVASAYAMPIIGTLIAGPEKTGLVRTRKGPSFPRRTPAPASFNPSRSST